MDFNTLLQSKYLGAVIVVFAFLIIGKIGTSILKVVLHKIAERKKADMDALKLGRLEFFILSILTVLAIKIILPSFVATNIDVVQNVLSSLIVFLMGFILLRVVGFIAEVFVHPLVAQTENKLDDQILSWIQSASGLVIFIIIALYIMSVWGVEIAPVLASLGIAGLAVALALQPTLANIFSGIALVIDKTFEPGDTIKIESGEVGQVFKVGLRTTRIKTFDNEIITIPNSNLANERVVNYYQPNRSVRVNVDFGVEYGVDPEYVKVIILEELAHIPNTDEDKQKQVWFQDMADSALTFSAKFWVDDISKKLPAQQEAKTRIYRRLYKEGIGIPFPQTTMWMRDEKKYTTHDPQDRKFSSVKGKFLPKLGHPLENDKVVRAQMDKKLKAAKKKSSPKKK